MGNFIENRSIASGNFPGSVLAQASGRIGGYKHVFVSLAGPKAGPQYPPHGGILKNPFKGMAKMYAGDLVEYKVDGSCYLLKSYEVDKPALESAVKVHISSGADKHGEIFRHIPFVGDVLMVAPETADGKGKAVTVTKVEKTHDAQGFFNGWDVTLSEALGALEAGAVLVEAESAGSNKKPMVTNPNCYLETDYDCIFEAASGDEDYEGAKYLFTPTLMEGREYAWIDRMSPLPAYVKAMNESKVPEWFKL